jgi:hypothetical protein
MLISMEVFSQEEESANQSLISNNLEQNEGYQLDNYDASDRAIPNQYSKLDLNQSDFSVLQEYYFLNALDIESILNHKKSFGRFVDIYELQSVPNLDIEKAKTLSLYFKIGQQGVFGDFKNQLKKGSHHLLFSANQCMQLASGYVKSNDVETSKYEGAPQGVFIKYNYKYRNELSYGFTADKDPGESFFKGSNRKGFDFYSAHLFFKNRGRFKSIAFGDFAVNFGQGLVLWQSFAFKKGADILQIKRQGDVLKPYTSSNENNFMRGVGFTIKHNRVECTLFSSSGRKDANGILDTSMGMTSMVSSDLTSGMHRTFSEIGDEKIQHENIFGMRLSQKSINYTIGFNYVNSNFRLTKTFEIKPYNLFYFQGNHLSNYSFDYAFTQKNIHVFGEMAMCNNKSFAMVNGMLLSINKYMDISILQRKISTRYQSFYSSAFSEKYLVNNENGFYMGLNVKGSSGLQLNAFMDIYKFPWLKYAVDFPSNGSEWHMKLSYAFNKKNSISLSTNHKSDFNNASNENQVLKNILQKDRYHFRLQYDVELNEKLSFSNRLDFIKYKLENKITSDGFLFYTNFKIKNMLKKLNTEFRFILFDSESYDSRLYAFENDLLQSFAINNYYGKGARYFLIMKYKESKNLSFMAKWSVTSYFDRTTIGSSTNQISGNKISELKLQAYYTF